VETDRAGFVTGVPRAMYRSNFEVEHHDYSTEMAQSANFKKGIAKLIATGRPLLILVTNREGSLINFGRYHSLYLRMDISKGKLQWTLNDVDPYCVASHVWDDDFMVLHIHMASTCFFMGEHSVDPVLPLDFLEQLQKLLGVEKMPVSAVVLAGGSQDVKYFCQRAYLCGSREDGSIAFDDTMERLRILADSRLKALGDSLKLHSSGCELIFVGTGLVFSGIRL
jgi:hypothetical protein